ncbi:MAG: hypothetical protein LW884_04410 [Bacteroidetes bacterium]|jgi:heme exporter protein B|nr:hypothetical protein [Bacteroidota bacterium]
MLRTLHLLIRLEWMLERRSPTAVYSLLFYGLLLAFTIGLAYHQPLPANTWAVLYMIAQAFVAITAVGKSFLAEPAGIAYYRHQLARPAQQMLARLLYNALLMLLLQLLLTLAFLLFVPRQGGVPAAVWALAGLTALAYAAALTLNAALASAGSQKSMLMAILSLPVQLPILLTGIGALQKLFVALPYGRDLQALAAMALGFGLLSYILYPFIARD